VTLTEAEIAVFDLVVEKCGGDARKAWAWFMAMDRIDGHTCPVVEIVAGRTEQLLKLVQKRGIE
jgi:hypothetical protein